LLFSFLLLIRTSQSMCIVIIESVNTFGIMKKLLICLSFLLSIAANGQTPLPLNGVANPEGRLIAIVNSTIHTTADIEYLGTILIQRNRIVAIGKDIKVPQEALVVNLQGKHVYPAMIDLWSQAALPDNPKPSGSRDLMERNDRGSLSWNMAIHPEENASLELGAKEGEFSAYRNVGFGAVCSHIRNGIARGTGTVICLADKNSNEYTILPKAASFFSFNKGNSTQDYPSSLMGSIALLRQAFLDVEWYRSGANKFYTDLSLQAFIDQEKLPKFIETSSWRDILRAKKIADEQGFTFNYKGSGEEYQRLEAFKEFKPNLILPLNFPEAWDVRDAYAANLIPMSELWHWEAAPANAALLNREKIPIAFTAAGLKSPSQFWQNLSKAVKAGLPSKEALRACTETPAKWIGVWNDLGSIEVGKFANLMVFSDTLFSRNMHCDGTWVQGEWYPNGAYNAGDIDGLYSFTINDISLKARIETKAGEISLSPGENEHPRKTKVNRENDRIDFQWKDSVSSRDFRMNGAIISFNPKVIIQGKAILSDGTAFPFELNQLNDSKLPPKPDTAYVFKAEVFEPQYPFHAFGSDELPQEETILYQNATLWTCEGNEVPQIGDILIHSGKIIAIGKGLSAERLLPKGIQAKVISAEGKHITPGIIDEHSHIAIERGINEGTQNNTAEVRIGDVLYDEDAVMYFQLAGGVTSAQLLHGSANPIGGQSAIIKLRWGKTPEELKNKNAPGHIKFALGENVKQSNWGDRKNTRFPQTRMGVEQVYYDAFQRAKEYQKEKELWQKSSAKQRAILQPFRQDLELDAIVEILEGKRNITCHSYVQSEINMLMHVADSMGFKVNTFTHILEGYKVADKMKAHGANASTFSDWWAYKFEVNDAIPYNAAILTKMGVNTSINSDDGEMGRRLNQEAAKTVMYGGLTEVEALKLITINPAKMLKIDGTTGSLKVGKDADIVVWSDNPLSIKAKVETTIIDGARYYDKAKHAERLKYIEEEQGRLTEELLKQRGAEASKRKPEKKKRHEYHCDDLYTGEHLEMEVAQ
jgi:imidazolonepropionase-like amidohydrolase